MSEWEKREWWNLGRTAIYNEPLSEEEINIAKALWCEMRMLAAEFSPVNPPQTDKLRDIEGNLPELEPDHKVMPSTLTIKNYGGLWHIETAGDMMDCFTITAEGRGVTFADALKDMLDNE